MTRNFYRHIFPNFTVVNVEKPPCFLRKFSPDGRRFLVFSADQTSVEIYDFQGWKCFKLCTFFNWVLKKESNIFLKKKLPWLNCLFSKFQYIHIYCCLIFWTFLLAISNIAGCEVAENLLGSVSGEVMHERSNRLQIPAVRALHEKVREQLFGLFFKRRHLVPVATEGQHLNRHG